MKAERIAAYERFAEVKKEWNALLSRSEQDSPFLTHQWFDAWWQSFGWSNTMEILFFRDDSGSPAGIAPLMASNETLAFIASHEVTDYCDFIFAENRRGEFYAALWDHFQRNSFKWPRIELINIPDGSAALSELPHLADEHGYIWEVRTSEIVPKLHLPESYGEYLDSLGRKNRHELRRKLRKLETLGQIRIQRIREPEKLRDPIEAFVSMHGASSPEKQAFWQKQGMPGFFNLLSALFSSVNWMDLRELYVADRMVASLLSFHYGDTVYFYNVAYDKEFSPYSPGFALFHHAIEKAIAENASFADFLRGREKYKYFFGAKESKIYSLKLRMRDKRP
jgi:CelD/BcsL family acetyltransferase involved in cellulose biosynthesis